MFSGLVLSGAAARLRDSNAIIRSTQAAGRLILNCSIKSSPNILHRSFSNSQSTPREPYGPPVLQTKHIFNSLICSLDFKLTKYTSDRHYQDYHGRRSTERGIFPKCNSCSNTEHNLTFASLLLPYHYSHCNTITIQQKHFYQKQRKLTPYPHISKCGLDSYLGVDGLDVHCPICSYQVVSSGSLTATKTEKAQ